MNKIAALFAGQGSQYPGMGIKLSTNPLGKKIFQQANETLDIDIESICLVGTAEELARTDITQPAILTCSIAAFQILMSNGTIDRIVPEKELCAVAGLSVGEYSALVANGALSFVDALKIVRERGRLMAEACENHPGTMVAIIGLDADTLNSICEQARNHGFVGPANYNCPGQIVISGDIQAVNKAVELSKKAGAIRCIQLDVNGAFHSPLMQSAEIGLRKLLQTINFQKPQVPLVANITGDFVSEPYQITELLSRQVSSPVQWEASIRRMIDKGIKTFFEFGPGKVLSGLVRRISKEVNTYSSEDLL